jgi:uncharacterized protein (DUF1330 family)
MPAYCLFDNLNVTDPAKLRDYKDRTAAVVAQYQGRYLVIGGRVDLVEGLWRPAFPVLLEFATIEQAHRWYASDEYRELKFLRHSAGQFNAVFIEGLPPQGPSGGSPQR